MRFILIYILIGLSSITGISQDCSSPINLCAGTPEVIDSTSFSGAFVSTCFSSLESVFYEFTTNNNVTNTSAFLPYEVEVSITISNCIDAGVALPLTAGVYEATLGFDPCAGLTETSPCLSDENAVLLNSGELEPNTTYFVVLGIDPTTTGFACDVDVNISGSPLEIDACCDATIIVGESSSPQVFGVTQEFGQDNYTWSPVESLDDFQSANPIATPSITTTYEVSGLVGDCVTTDEITITVSSTEILGPVDLFTPNGDGINDTWRIFEIEKFENPLINIYDRWGQQVYQSIGYDKAWDGTNEGKRLSTGTYYYVIEVNTLNGIEQLTGHIALLN